MPFSNLKSIMDIIEKVKSTAENKEVFSYLVDLQKLISEQQVSYMQQTSEMNDLLRENIKLKNANDEMKREAEKKSSFKIVDYGTVNAKVYMDSNDIGENGEHLSSNYYCPTCYNSQGKEILLQKLGSDASPAEWLECNICKSKYQYREIKNIPRSYVGRIPR